MTQKGIDCASTLTASIMNLFIADGVSFVVRYLDESSWKRMTAGEAKIISNAGVRLGSVFERKGDRASVVGSQGAADGQSALRSAKAVGQPEGSTIYFAVDYEAGPADMDNIEAYLRAADQVTPGYHIGVYGSYYVIEAMFNRGVCKYFWQTIAWSRGNRSTHANIFQLDIDKPVHGIGIDHNESYGNEGFWNLNDAPIVSQADSDLITGGLGALWSMGATVLGTIPTTQEEIHRLADVVRAAIGKTQPSITVKDHVAIDAALGVLWSLGVTSFQGKTVDKDIIHRLANVVRQAAGVPLT